jgi:hypothetical protein
VLQIPSTLPVSRGRYVLLKVLSDQDDGPVYLAVLHGTKKLRVIKSASPAGRAGGVPDSLRGGAKVLAKMQSAHLATVVASPEVEADGGLVMEYFAGKPLAAISRRAEEYSVLLPPELGLIVAHDMFAAAEFFHGFEGGLLVHGNITANTILVGYSGDAKLAGYRPGLHSPAGVDVHVSKDLKPFAGLLSELTFEMFPKELATLVPRLLEDNVSPMEATAAVRAFLHDYQPSAEQRHKVAAWLTDLFLGQRAEEAQEEARLLAAGMQLLKSVSAPRPAVKRASVVGGTTALLALVGGGALLMAHRRPDQPRPDVAPGESVAKAARQPAVALTMPGSGASTESPAPTVVPPAAPAAPTDSAVVPLSRPKSTSDTPDRPSKHEPIESPAEHLLQAAEVAFNAGKRVEAVNLGLRAVNAGGGVRAHLALGEYYRSMHRYQEAMNHYRSVAEIDPENKLALAGVQMLEKKLAPCR